MELWRQIAASEFENVGLAATLVHLAVAIALGQVLAWHFVRYARVISNRRRFARIFVFITTTTLLLISVVKTSLALSLGLVGALSIIRFRTPIKEPEELAYLFMAIAVGVGLGADRMISSVVVFGIVLAFLALRSGSRHRDELQTVLHVSLPAGDRDADVSGSDRLDRLLPLVSAACTRVDLRRVDRHEKDLHVSMLVELQSSQRISELVRRTEEVFPRASVSVVERDPTS